MNGRSSPPIGILSAVWVLGAFFLGIGVDRLCWRRGGENPSVTDSLSLGAAAPQSGSGAAAADGQPIPSKSPGSGVELSTKKVDDCAFVLDQMPLPELSQRISDRYEKVQSEVVDARYPHLVGEEATEEQLRRALEEFPWLEEEFSYWIAHADLPISQSHLEVVFIFTARRRLSGVNPQQASRSEGLKITVPAGAGVTAGALPYPTAPNLEWSLEMLVPVASADGQQGLSGASYSGGMLAHLTQRQGRYFGILHMNGGRTLDNRYLNAAVSVPSAGADAGVVDLLNSKTQKWLDAPLPLRWQQVSAEEVRRLRDSE